jgi:hypothetical protein
MTPLGTPDGETVETPVDAAVVPTMINDNRSRLDTATSFVDGSTQGANRVVHLLGAGGRFVIEPLATATGEVVRSLRSMGGAYRSAVEGGEDTSSLQTAA